MLPQLLQGTKFDYNIWSNQIPSFQFLAVTKKLRKNSLKKYFCRISAPQINRAQKHRAGPANIKNDVINEFTWECTTDCVKTGWTPQNACKDAWPIQSIFEIGSKSGSGSKSRMRFIFVSGNNVNFKHDPDPDQEKNMPYNGER